MDEQDLHLLRELHAEVAAQRSDLAELHEQVRLTHAMLDELIGIARVLAGKLLDDDDADE